MTANHEPCPRCGEQPTVTKGPSYWIAYCPNSHLPGRWDAVAKLENALNRT